MEDQQAVAAVAGAGSAAHHLGPTILGPVRGAVERTGPRAASAGQIAVLQVGWVRPKRGRGHGRLARRAESCGQLGTPDAAPNEAFSDRAVDHSTFASRLWLPLLRRPAPDRLVDHSSPRAKRLRSGTARSGATIDPRQGFLGLRPGLALILGLHEFSARARAPVCAEVTAARIGGSMMRASTDTAAAANRRCLRGPSASFFFSSPATDRPRVPAVRQATTRRRHQDGSRLADADSVGYRHAGPDASGKADDRAGEKLSLSQPEIAATSWGSPGLRRQQRAEMIFGCR